MRTQCGPVHPAAHRRRATAAFAAAWCVAASGAAQPAEPAQPVELAQLSLDRLGDLSLEQLGSIRVTSVSRRSERLLQAPASVFVITAEEIRRSGARSLPEALRLAPNLQVARTSAGQWAISARGFNNAIGNKLLVLVDGRTVYSPLFSGVFWDQQDVMLEDVDRIEVISGPGATLWGANAVNGVINVTTRPASATQGALVALTGGSEGENFSARYGGKLGEDGHFRLYTLGTNRDASARSNGVLVRDAAQKRQVGLRADWGQPDHGFTLQGDSYRGGELPGTPEAPKISGTNLLARWSQRSDDGSGWRLQGYYDHSKRDEPFTFRDDMEIADVEWQHSPAFGQAHKLVWGAGHRQARDRTTPGLLVRFTPGQRKLHWTNIFMQGELPIADEVALTLGAKAESNVYTGWEFLPSARSNGVLVRDAAQKRQVGLRADWGQPDHGFTLQGDSYRGGELPGTPEAPKISGTNLLARWSRRSDDGSSWRLQGYYDHSKRDEPFTFRDDMEIADVEWQHSPAFGQARKLVWGAGHRQARDRTMTGVLVRFTPPQRQLRWTNIFMQGELPLADQLALTLGAKAESNIYTGWEFLPSARLAWTPSETQMGWTALSRAVRAPARLDREFFFPGNAPFIILGGPNFESEVANVLELGWRAQPTPTLSWSATLFHHRYDKLRSGQPPPAVVQNMIEGTATGLEAWATWQVTGSWRLSGGLNELRKSLRLKPGSTDPSGPRELGNDPRHQWTLRSNLHLAPGQELDLGVRHVSALPYPAVPAYTAVDLRWGWNISRTTELSLVVQNLFDRGHVEFGTAAGASEWRRTAWLKLLWRM